jgi:hypothetical protein
VLLLDQAVEEPMSGSEDGDHTYADQRDRLMRSGLESRIRESDILS